MKPYYEHSGITIYNGSCIEVLQSLELEGVSIITDPVWPNATADLKGKEAPFKLLRTALQSTKPAKRLAVHLGRDSDPRFLRSVPSFWKFFGTCWLEYVRPHYKGRLMYGADVAYLFGEPPASKPGQHVIPGRIISSSSSGKEADHPCPRKLEHVKWLVKWWSEPTDLILDPFMGSGTTLRAAKDLERRAIGIEVEECFCEVAATRLAQSVLPFNEPPQPAYKQTEIV